MAREQWVGASDRLGGFPAIKIKRSQDTDDVCLAGYYGEVWGNLGALPDRAYKAVLDGRGLRRLYLNPPAGLKLPPHRGADEECIITFSKAQLPAVLKAIRYSTRRPTQIKLASSR